MRWARRDQLRGRRLVVVGGDLARAVAREQAGVEHARRDHRHVAPRALRQQVVQRALFEQRVAPGEHDHVEVGLADEVRQHLGLVHPRAVGRDDALRAQLLERREGPVERLPVVLVGIVHEQEVDAVEPEPLEAGFEEASTPSRL